MSFISICFDIHLLGNTNSSKVARSNSPMHELCHALLLSKMIIHIHSQEVLTLLETSGEVVLQAVLLFYSCQQ